MRRLEGDAPAPGRAMSNAATVDKEDELVKRIVTKVTEELRRNGVRTADTPRRDEGRRIPRGPCYNCGKMNDHFARDCPHPRRDRQQPGTAPQSRPAPRYMPLNGAGLLGGSNQQGPQ